MKYDTNGNLLWNRTFNYNSSLPSSDTAYGVAVDTSGNVYVAGNTNGNLNTIAFLTVKYDTNGNYQWNRTFTINRSNISYYNYGQGVAVV